jgi:broad specificity phosphatase PhoE
MPIRVLLVRHAQSEWNADGRWQGQEDPPLSALGEQQAVAASEHVGAFDAIVASPLERAAHTAAILAEATGVGPVLLDEDLQERFAGEFQGLTRDEIEQQYPGYLDEGKRPPGWESDEALEARTSAVLERIASIFEGRGVEHAEVLVLTHGGVIYRLEDELGVREGRIPNLGGRWIERVGEGRWKAGDRVVLIDEGEAPITTPNQI